MIGTRTIATTGRGVRASADGRPSYKISGATIDWATVTAVSVDTTLADGTVVLAGDKYIAVGTVLTRITASGKFGPYASGAGDGRQTLRRGDCYILDRDLIASQLHSDQVGEVFDSGRVYMARILPAAISTNPADATLLAAFPGLIPVRD